MYKSIMQRIHLRTVDLNLLVVFDAVMSERSVTRAAYRLHLTQPAVSHALSRLRALFKDPLFLRTPAGLEPTPRSSALAGRVAAVLSEIGSIFVSDMAFDPATSERRVAVGMSDYAAFVVLSSLVARLQRPAPAPQTLVDPTKPPRAVDMRVRGGGELL